MERQREEESLAGRWDWEENQACHAIVTALTERRAERTMNSDAQTMPGICTIEKPSFMFCFVAYFEGASCSGAWVLILRYQSCSPNALANKPSALTLKI